MPTLEFLDLSETQITDDGWGQFDAPALQELRINNTTVTDMGVAKLSNLPSLRLLGAVGTGVTKQAYKLLPNVTIECDDPFHTKEQPAAGN